MTFTKRQDTKPCGLYPDKKDALDQVLMWLNQSIQ